MNPEQFQPEPEESPVEALAERLDILQGKENGGNGISCVKGIVFYLRQGDLARARAFYLTDRDKIRNNYPEILALLENSEIMRGT